MTDILTDVLFHEVYNSYYRAVAKLIEAAQGDGLDETAAVEQIRETAFSESFLYILESIKSGQWQVMTPQLETPLKKTPARPMTTLEKRWIEAVRLDPRMALFQESGGLMTDGGNIGDGNSESTAARRENTKSGAENAAEETTRQRKDTDGRGDGCPNNAAEPLYLPEDFYITDQALDGDPYGSEAYQAVFRTALKAIKEQSEVEGVYINGKGKARRHRWMTYRLEYSEKDDKFRLLARDESGAVILNLSRLQECRICGLEDAEENKIHRLRKRNRNGRITFKKKKAVLLLTDDRNALERCMLHFADLEKTTIRLDDRRYRVELYYRREDETEIVIRILSFGPFLQAISPPQFVGLIVSRLKKQIYLNRVNAGSKEKAAEDNRIVFE